MEDREEDRCGLLIYFCRYQKKCKKQSEMPAHTKRKKDQTTTIEKVHNAHMMQFIRTHAYILLLVTTHSPS